MGHDEKLLKIYNLLNEYFGDLRWWPADSAFEMMVGAVLTQNTAWTNVEKAIANLRRRRLLTPAALLGISDGDLAEVIRPSGYYHLKTARLKALGRFFMDEYSGRIGAMKAERLPLLRKKLLEVTGIGPETADSILLYACRKPIFVVDSYTRRIFHRHGLIDEQADYDGIQNWVMASLPNQTEMFGQFHALIVVAAKTFCRKRPTCAYCPLSVLNAKTVV